MPVLLWPGLLDCVTKLTMAKSNVGATCLCCHCWVRRLPAS